jgi:hypothetical protein
MNLKKIFLVALTAFASYSHARIVEHNSMQCVFDCIQEHADDKTLLLFDVDQTLIVPMGYMGTAQWCSFIFDNALKKSGNRMDAIEQEAVARFVVSPHLTYQCVEHDTALLIQQLQNCNHLLLAFTTRDPRLATYTHNALVNCGIDFSSAPLPPALNGSHAKKHHFEQGIIFSVAQLDKGTVLIDMLHDYPLLRPTKIIFCDDVLRNVQAVERALAESFPMISFLGIHYVPMDDCRPSFAVAKAMADTVAKDFNLDAVKDEIDALAIDASVKTTLLALHQ